jgi:hypothetical protein
VIYLLPCHPSCPGPCANLLQNHLDHTLIQRFYPKNAKATQKEWSPCRPSVSNVAILPSGKSFLLEFAPVLLNILCSFDESETFSSARTGHPVLFYGVVVIKSLAWLTPIGRKWLEIDLRKRDIEKGMHPEVCPVSKLTLQGLYGTRDSGVSAGDIFGEGMKSNLRLKVWIQGEKNMSVSFLTCMR